MTLISPRPGCDVVLTITSPTPQQRTVRAPWTPRPFCDLVEDQLAAVESFLRNHRAAEELVDASARSREERLDARRRLDVLRRQRDALVTATAQAMDRSGGVLHTVGPRALLVHRNEWLRRRVAQDLERRGVELIAQLDNGAEGVGVLVAEQPDLLFVEDTLPMVGGLQVLAEARRYAPRTLLSVQVGYDDQLPAAWDAGAVAAFTRRIPPADIGDELAALLAT